MRWQLRRTALPPGVPGNQDGSHVDALPTYHPPRELGAGARFPLSAATRGSVRIVATARSYRSINDSRIGCTATGSVPGGSVPGAVDVGSDGVVVGVVVELVVVVGDVDDVALVGGVGDVVSASPSSPAQAAMSKATVTRTLRSGSRRFTRPPPRSPIPPTVPARARLLRVRTASWIVRRVGLRQRPRRSQSRRGS
jgi:hypothetical protein